jgi:anti-sigma factor RsiW
MSDCTNLDMRDLLPDLARGALSGSSLVAVEQHLATCASCRAELALVQSAQRVLGVAPPVNTARIAAAVRRAGAHRRVRDASMPQRRVWLLAASVAAVAAATALVANMTPGPADSDLPPVVIEATDLDTTVPRSRQPSDPRGATAPPPAHAELVVAGGVSELADADLESLLRALDGLDVQIDPEPAPLPPLVEGEG